MISFHIHACVQAAGCRRGLTWFYHGGLARTLTGYRLQVGIKLATPAPNTDLLKACKNL